MVLRCMLMRVRTTALRPPPPSSGQTSSPVSLLAGALRSPAAVLMTPHTSPAAAAASSRRHLSTLFRQELIYGCHGIAKTLWQSASSRVSYRLSLEPMASALGVGHLCGIVVVS
uniref:Uncharacterized protein n=1 Tax=Oryza meridionalis TaxID=40149 RepID=A0A0E0E7G7_9ORYZ